MRILIVDDSKAMRMIVRSHLRKAGYGKHTYVEACNGAEALEMIKQELPDVVLSDWNMPEMTGIQLLTELNKLHKEKVLSAMPAFVFITSESTDSMRDQAKQEGATCFITKPFTDEVFESQLEDIITD